MKQTQKQNNELHEAEADETGKLHKAHSNQTNRPVSNKPKTARGGPDEDPAGSLARTPAPAQLQLVADFFHTCG